MARLMVEAVQVEELLVLGLGARIKEMVTRQSTAELLVVIPEVGAVAVANTLGLGIRCMAVAEPAEVELPSLDIQHHKG